MIERRVIRLLTVFSPMYYYLDGPEQRGIVYESALQFEKGLNKALKRRRLQVRVVIIPIPRNDLIPALVEGRGDIAAANLTITPERLEQVDFSEPILREVSEIIVTGPAADDVATLDDLAGREIHLRAASSYWSSVERFNEQLHSAGKKPMRPIEAPRYFSDEGLLEMVNAGVIPMTIIDRHKADFWAQFFDNIVLHPDVALRSGGEIGWAFRKESPQLAGRLNEFVRRHRKGTLFGNVIFNRYLREGRWVRSPLDTPERARLEEISSLLRKYAGEYRFDWTLIAAQAYQESRLRQDLRSHRGAVGVMQILPTTAAEIGISDITSLENNIHAGVKYLRYIVDRYFDDEEIEPAQRHLFGLAAYNAGPRRIVRLRAAARSKGFDPNRWFDNVEVLAARSIGSETVRYVGNIAKYYVAYRMIATQLGGAPAERPTATPVTDPNAPS
jgi:membrane-bound lytic murein transglycosylase MltF